MEQKNYVTAKLKERKIEKESFKRNYRPIVILNTNDGKVICWEKQ